MEDRRTIGSEDVTFGQILPVIRINLLLSNTGTLRKQDLQDSEVKRGKQSPATGQLLAVW